MADRIAVDVVLLPEPSLADGAVKVNRAMVDRFGSEIVLDRQTCMPHVSLAMGCMDLQEVDGARQVLHEIAATAAPGPLTLIGTAVVVNSRGVKVSSWLIAKTEPLQQLHELVSTRLARFFTYDPEESMLFGPGPIAATTLDWIRDFPRESSFSFFWPHITLGYGEAPSLPSPVAFTAVRLAICHLGNHCTCRKVLASVQYSI